MSKIGIALGGGGAKGFAHIGVLRGLEQLNIQPDIVTGTSAGGIIGLMYAAGLSVDEIEMRARSTGLAVFASLERSRLGLFGRDKFARWLEDVVGNVTFDRLPRKLAVVAVDLESEQEVVLDSGRVIDAVLATTAYPGVFAPFVRDGRYLIDGGVLNNVPFDVARNLGAECVIASNVTAHRGPLFPDVPETGTLPETLIQQLFSLNRAAMLWAVVDRTISIMQDGHVRDKVERCPPDVMLCPPVGHVGLFDVRHLDECIEVGLAVVHVHQTQLLELRNRAAQPPSIWDRLRQPLARRS